MLSGSRGTKMLGRVYDTQGDREQEVKMETNGMSSAIPEGVKMIKKGQIEGMFALTSVTLPSSLESIGERALYKTGLCDVFFKEEIKRFECKVPEFIKKILEQKGIECPNFYHDEEDTRREMIVQFKVTKEKWEITRDIIMIIGKYFESSEDFMNVMRVCKKYKQLVSMYHFNPISEWKLFKNMETQYLYEYRDVKKPKMHQYVYFYIVDYEKSKNKNENEVFKRVELNGVSKDLYGGYNPFGMQQRMDMNNGNYVVPEGVTSIGNNCFNGCKSIKILNYHHH